MLLVLDCEQKYIVMSYTEEFVTYIIKAGQINATTE